jgi:hypothetical protein
MNKQWAAAGSARVSVEYRYTMVKQWAVAGAKTGERDLTHLGLLRSARKGVHHARGEPTKFRIQGLGFRV